MPNTAKLVLETVEQGLRFGVTAGSGQRTVVDSGPGMVAPSPVELLLVSLGGCQAMDVIAILRKKRQSVTAYEVDVTGERRAEHPRKYTRIDVLHRLTGRNIDPQAVRHAIELSHTKYCSISASIDPAIEVMHRFEIAEAAS